MKGYDFYIETFLRINNKHSMNLKTHLICMLFNSKIYFTRIQRRNSISHQ